MSKKLLSVVDLGLVSYAEALEFQRAAARARISGELAEDLLILVEHPPVVTLGRSSKEKNLIASPEFLAARGVEVFEVERGGDVTFHGPGQLVGYPIINLRQHKQDLHWYLRQIELVLIRALADQRVPAQTRDKLTGVWTAGEGLPRKIASIGVHARDWVTWHGFALNVNTDLRYFDFIVPCGIDGVVMTSIAEERDEHVDDARVRTSVVDAFSEVFDLTAQSLETPADFQSLAATLAAHK